MVTLMIAGSSTSGGDASLTSVEASGTATGDQACILGRGVSEASARRLSVNTLLILFILILILILILGGTFVLELLGLALNIVLSIGGGVLVVFLGMSRAVLKYARQASLVEQAMRRRRADQEWS